MPGCFDREQLPRGNVAARLSAGAYRPGRQAWRGLRPMGWIAASPQPPLNTPAFRSGMRTNKERRRDAGATCAR